MKAALNAHGPAQSRCSINICGVITDIFFGHTTQLCGILVPQPRTKTEAQSHKQWTTREFPDTILIIFIYFTFWQHWVFTAACALLITGASLVAEYGL